MRLGNLSIACLLFSGLVLISCATSPSVEARPSGINLLAASDIAKFGTTFEINPLLPSSSLIRGQVDRFIVLKFTIRTERAELVQAWARLEDAEGSNLGSFMSRNDMIDYRSIYTVDSADSQGRDKLARIYLPSDEFKCGKGYHVYYVVVRVPASVKQGARIVAKLIIGDQDPIDFSEELPAIRGN